MIDPERLSEPEKEVLRELSFDKAKTLREIQLETTLPFKEGMVQTDTVTIDDTITQLLDKNLVMLVPNSKYRLPRQMEIRRLIVAISI